MKHTPAPWKLEIDWDERHPIAIIDPTTESHPQGALHICNINPNLQDESLANARLIAAAPELLDALEKVTFALETIAIMDGNEEIKKYAIFARAAIAKAKGE